MKIHYEPMNEKRERVASPFWISAIWAMVGLELLCILYFSVLGPPRFNTFYEPGNIRYTDPELLVFLGRVMAWVNLTVVLGLWAQLRRYRRLAARFDFRRVACVVTALSLLFAPFVATQIGLRSSRLARRLWIIKIGPIFQHDADGWYEVLMYPPDQPPASGEPVD